MQHDAALARDRVVERADELLGLGEAPDDGPRRGSAARRRRLRRRAGGSARRRAIGVPSSAAAAAWASSTAVAGRSAADLASAAGSPHRARSGRSGSLGRWPAVGRLEMGVENGDLRVARERHLPGQALVQQAAERVDVRARVEALAADLLGRHVMDGSERPLGRGDRASSPSRLLSPKSPSHACSVRAAARLDETSTLLGLTSRWISRTS